MLPLFGFLIQHHLPAWAAYPRIHVAERQKGSKLAELDIHKSVTIVFVDEPSESISTSSVDNAKGSFSMSAAPRLIWESDGEDDGSPRMSIVSMHEYWGYQHSWPDDIEEGYCSPVLGFIDSTGLGQRPGYHTEGASEMVAVPNVDMSDGVTATSKNQKRKEEGNGVRK